MSAAVDAKKPELVEGWHVLHREQFEYIRGAPPRRGTWWLQLRTDLRSPKMQLGFAVIIATTSAGLAMHLPVLSGLGIILAALYLRMFNAVVGDLRDSPLRSARVQFLGPHPTFTRLRVSPIRISEGEAWIERSVVLENEPAETLLREHRELEVLFLDAPKPQLLRAFALRPATPGISHPDQPPRQGRGSFLRFALSAVSLVLIGFVMVDARSRRAETRHEALNAPMVVEAWVPVVKELRTRGLSSELTVLVLSCWELELESHEQVGGRFQRAIATTAVALGEPTNALATRVVGKVATAELAQAAVQETKEARSKLNALPGVVRVGAFLEPAGPLLVSMSRTYAASKRVPLPHTAQPSTDWLVLLAELKKAGIEDPVVLASVTRRLRVTLKSGKTVDALDDEAAVETVAAATGADVTEVRFQRSERVMQDARAPNGLALMMEAFEKAKRLLSGLPEVDRVEFPIPMRGPAPAAQFDGGALPPAAPWERSADPPSSMRWRMGGGEDLMDRWQQFWRSLPDPQRQRYLAEHQPPREWAEWIQRVFGADAARSEPGP